MLKCPVKNAAADPSDPPCKASTLQGQYTCSRSCVSLACTWESSLYLLYPDGAGAYCTSMKQLDEVYEQHAISDQWAPMKWEAAKRHNCAHVQCIGGRSPVWPRRVATPRSQQLSPINQSMLLFTFFFVINQCYHQLYKLMPDKPTNSEPYARPAGAIVAMRACVDRFVAQVVEPAGRPVNKKAVMEGLVQEELGKLEGIRKRAQVRACCWTACWHGEWTLEVDACVQGKRKASGKSTIRATMFRPY